VAPRRGSAIRAGTLSGDRGPTLDQAAAEFLEAAATGTALTPHNTPYKPSAVRNYESSLRLTVLPALGRHRLGDLRLIDIQRFVDRLARQGRTASAISRDVMPLRAVYRRAVRLGQVPANPTRGLQLPAGSRRRDKFATPAQAEAMLAVLDLPERAVWATALYAGLRRGELAGLRWGDVNLAAGLIHVQRGWDSVEGEIEPKTRSSRRKVAIPAALRDHLTDQRVYVANASPPGMGPRGAQERQAERRRQAHRLRAQGMLVRDIAEQLGVNRRTIGFDLAADPPPPPEQRDIAPAERVFTHGERIETIIKRGRDRILAAGLDPVMPHECRHTYASFMIAAGANAKTISTMMGHANIATTFDLYGHLMPGAEDQAAELLDSYLEAARADQDDELAVELKALTDSDGLN
jgi:integrase